MKRLITGASGFLGWRLCEWFAGRKGVELLAGRRRQDAPPQTQPLPLDLEAPDSVRRRVADARPDVVVHCAAWSQVGDCERDPDRAQRVNVDGTRAIAQALDSIRTSSGSQPHLIYISTDMVFDGRQGGYREDDAPHPLMVYGRTKWEGEQATLAYGGPATVLRMTLCYGPPAPTYGSFVQWLDQGLRSDAGVGLFTNEIRNAVYVDDVCMAIEAMIEKRAEGIYHIGGPENLSRAEFGHVYARIFGLDPGRIREITYGDVNLSVPRPADATLNIDKARRDLGFNPRGAEDALRRMKDL